MKPRLLVTGAAGFLGRHLIQQAEKDFTISGTLHRTPATGIPGVTFHVCDLRQPEEVRILLYRVRPEVIIHTACSERGEGLQAIVPAAALLAMQAAERGIRFIHLSTDQVFDGETAPYTENCPTNPINPYGQAKAQAEEVIASVNSKATVVRTSLLYDLRIPDRQTKQLIQTAQTGEPYRLFTDEFRCPVWVENLSEVLLELAGKDYAGILNLGSPERLNRWDLGMKLLTHFGITPTPNIQQGTIEESGLVRPKDLTMDSTKAQRLLSTTFLRIDDAMEHLSS
ncbi:MAG: NAD(P)-dependent oxidoreductase [Nitrospirales bacterium]